MKNIGTLVFFIMLVAAAVKGSWVSDTVKQNDVTFYFHDDETVDTFANGDHYVIAPVTIDSMHPTAVDGKHGWQVNPLVFGDQAFCDSCQDLLGGSAYYDAELMPDLPYTYSGDTIVSVCKSIWNTGVFQPCLKAVEVLTICAHAPPNNIFRPAYIGTDKTLYYVDSIHLEFLPRVTDVSGAPTFEYIKNRFKRCQFDPMTGSLGRSLRPDTALADYSPDNTVDQNEALLRFMCEDTIGIMPAIINYLQYGIDKIHTIYAGQTYPDGGGHQTGHLATCAFAVTMLNITKAKTVLDTATFFHGTRWFTRNKDSNTVFGVTSTDSLYWVYLRGLGGNRSNRDPYRYIDGGNLSFLEYQSVTSQSHKGEILAAQLMPEMLEAWPLNEFYMMQNYVDRWVLHGVISKPDPYAPFDGVVGNYGVTYGKGILGSGRFNDTCHGSYKNGGQFTSDFIDTLWEYNRRNANGADTIKPVITINNNANDIDTIITDSLSLSITTFTINKFKSIIAKLNGTDNSIPLNQDTSIFKTNIGVFQNGINTLIVTTVDSLNNSKSDTALIWRSNGSTSNRRCLIQIN